MYDRVSFVISQCKCRNGYLTTAQDMSDDLSKWQSWISHIALQGKLVHTAPLRYEAIVVGRDAIEKAPYKEANSVLVAGFLICKSDNWDELQEWSKTCPILRYPGSSVEIRTLIPFPTN